LRRLGDLWVLGGKTLEAQLQVRRGGLSPVWRTPGLIALIEEAAVIGRILRHLGVPTEIPVPHPARAPLPVGVPDVDGWDDDTSVFDACS
jgi:hypothetical protein